MSIITTALRKFLPFWLFIFLFKIGGVIHYTSLSALGERVLPVWVVGLLIGGSAILQLLCDVPAGFLIDRFGHSRLLRLTSFFLALGGLVLVFGLQIWTFIFMILFSAAGWLFFEPGVNAYLLSHAPSSYAGRYVGLREIFSSSGAFLGALAVPVVLQLPVSVLGVVIGVFLLAALAATLFMSSRKQTHIERKKIDTHHYYIRRQYIHRVIRAIKQLNPASTMLALANFSAGSFYGVLWFVVPLVIASQAGQGILGFGLSIFDLSGLIFGAVFGHFVDRSDKKNLAFLGLLVFAVMGMLVGVNFGVWFVVFGFLATAGEQLATISLWAWLNQLDRTHAHDGLIAGVITFFEDAGWAIGPIFAGLLYGIVGPTWTIIISSLFIFVTWIISSLLLHKPAALFVSTTSPTPARPKRWGRKG